MKPTQKMNHAQFLFFVLILSPLLAYSQHDQINNGNLNEPLPVDSQVVIGKLDNGFTYYLRQNEEPDNRMHLRLVVNAGSMQETEKQRGLAHFAEHMAFNGIKSFEENKLVDYLQSKGVKFGADLNAYTSFEETVYMLPIPADDPELLEKSLTILHDWSSQILFDKEEIDKERGVVIEEWRLGQNANMRMVEEYLPVLYKDSRYAERLPIGKKEVIENFERETLVSYYNDWYRPELMSIIAVGDFGLDSMENKIKNKFSDIKPRPDAPERVNYPVPNHDSTLIAIATDKEASSSEVGIVHKLPNRDLKTEADLLRHLKYQMVSGMLSRRLNELEKKADPAFISSYASFSNGIARSKDQFIVNATAGEKGLLEAYKNILIENERVQRHGFTQNELERYKKRFMQNIRQSYNERNNTPNNKYVSEYTNHFLQGEATPGIEFEKAFYESHIDKITIKDINPIADSLITRNNRVIVVTAPDTPSVKIPSKSEMRALLKDIENQEIEPYDEKQLPDQLMTGKPKAGKIKESTPVEAIDAHKMVLENGCTIYYKQTDFKSDEILMQAYSPGGHSLVPDNDYYSASQAAAIIKNSGVKDFSSTDLDKILSGKKVSVSPAINHYREGFSGNTTPDDLESMFQLLHLYITAPKMDSSAFQSYISKQKSKSENLLSNPRYFFFDKVSRVMSQNNIRGRQFWQPSTFDSVEFDKVYSIYKERMSNPGDFNFFFVGNINPDSLKQLAATYLGSIPGKDEKEAPKDLNIDPPKGKVKKVYKKGASQQSFVYMAFHGEMDYSIQEDYAINALSQVLNNMYIDSLREKEGGVYGISVRPSVSKIPDEDYAMQIVFPCAPENSEKLMDAALDIIEDVKQHGIDSAQINKVTSSMERNFEVNLEKNNYWVNQMESHHFKFDDVTGIPGRKQYIKALTPEMIQQTAKKYLDHEQIVKLILYPGGYKPEAKGEE